MFFAFLFLDAMMFNLSFVCGVLKSPIKLLVSTFLDDSALRLLVQRASQAGRRSMSHLLEVDLTSVKQTAKAVGPGLIPIICRMSESDQHCFLSFAVVV